MGGMSVSSPRVVAPRFREPRAGTKETAHSSGSQPLVGFDLRFPVKLSINALRLHRVSKRASVTSIRSIISFNFDEKSGVGLYWMWGEAGELNHFCAASPSPGVGCPCQKQSEAE